MQDSELGLVGFSWSPSMKASKPETLPGESECERRKPKVPALCECASRKPRLKLVPRADSSGQTQELQEAVVAC